MRHRHSLIQQLVRRIEPYLLLTHRVVENCTFHFGVCRRLRADHGQPFHDPVREGLPTTRPEPSRARQITLPFREKNSLPCYLKECRREIMQESQLRR